MRHLNAKYGTDQGVGAKYQKDSEKVKIPRKWIGLLILWVPIKVPFLVCVILLSRAVTAQSVPHMEFMLRLASGWTWQQG